MNLTVTLPILAAVCLAVDTHAQHVNRPAAKPPASRPQRPDRPERPAPKAEPKGRPAVGPGSAENLSKLLKLSPDQRTKALSSLPPARRTQIEKRLNDIQKMPAPEQANALEHLRRMQSLPSQKQQQVRASLRKLAELPQPRQGMVRRQIKQMRALSDVDRRALMNTEEFRSKFTPAEQQMVEDISLVTPQQQN